MVFNVTWKVKMMPLWKNFFCSYMFLSFLSLAYAGDEAKKQQDVFQTSDAAKKQGDISYTSSLQKLGIVYLNSILEVLPSYSIWRKNLEKWEEKNSEGLLKEKVSLEKEWKKLEGLRGPLGEAKYSEKRQGLETRLAKLEQSYTQMQQKIQDVKQSVAKFLDQEMQKILDELCSEHDISLVLNGIVVLRVKPNPNIINLTSQTARLMEKRVPSLDTYIPSQNR